MKFDRLAFISILFLLLYCTPKTVPIAVDENYEEDLSGTLPEITEYISPVILDEKPIDKTFIEPHLDVTAELDSLLDSIAIVNKQIPYFQYTILVHNSSSRKDAEDARKNIFRVIPDAKPELQFLSPTYRVKLGMYFSKIEAYQVLVKLKDQFPNAVIVPERLYFD